LSHGWGVLMGGGGNGSGSTALKPPGGAKEKPGDLEELVI